MKRVSDGLTLLAAAFAVATAGCQGGPKGGSVPSTQSQGLTLQHLIDLGEIGSAGNSSEGVYVNQAGEVAGTSVNDQGRNHPFFWSAATGMIDLMPEYPLAGGGAGALSEKGEVVGKMTGAEGGSAFYWSAATGRIAITPGRSSRAVAISSSGRVTGIGLPPLSSWPWGFTWMAPDGPVEWFADLGLSSSQLHTANDAGIAIGRRSFDGSMRPAAWNTATGETWDLSALGGGGMRPGEAIDINEAGQIVGNMDNAIDDVDKAVLWQLPDTLIVIDPLPGSIACYARDINAVGQVVGHCAQVDAAGTTGVSAFVWKDGVTQALGGRTRSGQYAITINDQGIIGGYEVENFSQYGFFWTPVDGTIPAVTLSGTTGGGILGSSSSGFFTGWAGNLNAHFDAVRYQISTASSPEEAADNLGGAVDTLVSEGSLGGGNGNALTSKLEAAAQQAERGNCKAARNQLTAFIQQVETLRLNGALSAQEAANLIHAAQSIIDELDC